MKNAARFTPAQTIKNAGFKTIKSLNRNYTNTLTSRPCRAMFLVNEEGKVLCYENTPYTPIGNRSAFAMLIESGDIKSECFSFKSINIL